MDALYVSTSARHPAAGEEAWCKVSRSSLSAIAREINFQAMKLFFTFSRGKASCRAAMDMGSSATGTPTSLVEYKQAVKFGEAEKILLPSWKLGLRNIKQEGIF